MDKLEYGNVLEILKCFKNLFTLSDAIFIFVAGEEVYNELNYESLPKKSEDVYRRKEYTYFTSKYFLSRPLSKDLDKLFESIVIYCDDEDEFEFLKKSLCFEAKNDFFDLKARIKDRITSFNRDTPEIIIDEIEGNDKRKAKFHEAVTILFEKKYMSPSQSRWAELIHIKEIFQLVSHFI